MSPGDIISESAGDIVGIRRQWFDIAKSPPAPTAIEALKRIAEPYEIEGEIRGESAAQCDSRKANRSPRR